MASIIDFAALLPTWPEDCAGQQNYFNRMKAALTTMNSALASQSPQTIYLSQSSEPNQAQWETAWTSQTGLSLPISASTRLLWYNTSTLAFGGAYEVVEGQTTVFRAEHRAPRGSIHKFGVAQLNTYAVITSNITLNNSGMPALTITTEVVCDIFIDCSLYVGITVGTGTWGVDYQINGSKIGTLSFSIGANEALHKSFAAGYISGTLVMQNQPPGVYVIQMMFGVSGAAGPTLVIGGSNGFRSLVVKAVAR